MLAVGSMIFVPLLHRPAISSLAPTPTIDATRYATRNWALPTATSTPIKRTLPCDADFEQDYLSDAAEYLGILSDWVHHWRAWIELYRKRGWHNLPAEVILAIIMHESRGGASARGADGEYGIMQVLPSSARVSGRELAQSSKNLYHGIGLLESYTWEATYYVENVEREYRPLRYDSVDAAADLSWWYSDTGRAAVGMYQCGPTGFQLGRCGPRGGLSYSADVLDCWLPWVEGVLYGQGGEPDGPAEEKRICRIVLPARRFRPMMCIG